MPVPPQTTTAQAEKELRAAGYEPLIPYPGRVLDPWPARCTTCAYEHKLTLNRIRAGRRCPHKYVSAQTALADAARAGFEPLEIYPGVVRKPWRLKCLSCGREYKRSLSVLRSSGGCDCRQRATAAETELRAAGYEPIEPFPGSARAPWPSRCTTCKQSRRPSLSTIRSGKRCLHLPPQ
ncbi:hypothetical protein GCM10010306_099460 [Streptomyces umbrinus]|nr:hypothetical protein GCM10010306_099460 [Streptomyces umbrinus]